MRRRASASVASLPLGRPNVGSSAPSCSGSSPYRCGGSSPAIAGRPVVTPVPPAVVPHVRPCSHASTWVARHALLAAASAFRAVPAWVSDLPASCARPGPTSASCMARAPLAAFAALCSSLLCTCVMRFSCLRSRLRPCLRCPRAAAASSAIAATLSLPVAAAIAVAAFLATASRRPAVLCPSPSAPVCAPSSSVAGLVRRPRLPISAAAATRAAIPIHWGIRRPPAAPPLPCQAGATSLCTERLASRRCCRRASPATRGPRASVSPPVAVYPHTSAAL